MRVEKTDELLPIKNEGLLPVPGAPDITGLSTPTLVVVPGGTDSPIDDETEEPEDDLLSLVEAEATEPDLFGDSATGEIPLPDDDEPLSKVKKSKKAQADPYPAMAVAAIAAEVGYRFPYSRSVLEIVPDIASTFCIRLVWHRGKAVLTLFESTALRPVAEIVRGGQKYPIFLSQHARKRRDRVVLGGKRKTAKSWRCALRCAAVVEAREDKFTFLWRITATAGAMQVSPHVASDGTIPEDEITLSLPLSPGKHQILTLPGTEGRGVVLWMNELAVSVVAHPLPDGSRAVLSADTKGIHLNLKSASLGGDGTVLRWDAWLSGAKTEAEAQVALLRHMADAADNEQISLLRLDGEESLKPFLRPLLERTTTELMRKDIVDKRGADKLVYRLAPGKSDRLAIGETVDEALIACTLLARYHMTGDDYMKQRARLLANGVCEFQINVDDSSHWGAFWDVRTKKEWTDINGEKTISVATTARTAKALHILNTNFNVDLFQRCATHAAQWIMLKTDVDGRIEAERFEESGPPVSDGSPWIMGETIIPLVEAFRVTATEVFFKRALRTVRTIQEGLETSTLPFSLATTEHLASTIEGVLMVSREYESEQMITLAKQLGMGLRARRLPDGSITDPTALKAFPSELPHLVPTLAGARAALALARVDNDPLWPLFALRAIRAAKRMLGDCLEFGTSPGLTLADISALCYLPMHLFLTIAQRANNIQADRDKVTVTRGWQTFAPDPATNEFVKIYYPGTEETVDHLSLVCPVTQQVLVAVLATPGTEAVDFIKNGKHPFLRNLLNGEYDVKANLVPLGDGTEAMIGVFLADT